MRILITNDDGIYAPGLDVLERIAATLSDDVNVVAPESDQSGVGHSLSLSNPLRLRKISERRYAVRGTPTDCVIMGVRSVLADKRPDLILSGVNHGQNVAEDITYSGTVAAAMEGTVLGIPSVAMSQVSNFASGVRSVHWETAESHAPALLKRLIATGFPRNVLLNINFPDCPASDVAGIAATCQGIRSSDLLRIDARHDGRGIPYYWLAFQRPVYQAGEGTDLRALAMKKISVTPLKLDLTDGPALTQLAAALE